MRLHPTARADDMPPPDARVARRGRVASAGLVVVLLTLSLIAVWSSGASNAAADRAVAATGLSDEYARAASAVSDEESLERKYRLEPGVEVRARYDAASGDLVAALNSIRRDGTAGDRALAERVLADHTDYLAAIERMFAAIDRGDAAEALRIDAQLVDPAFAAIEIPVHRAAVSQHQRALGSLADLQRLESLTRQLAPLVFLTGLLLVALLASFTRRHRRLLAAERARAMHDSLHDALTGLPNRALLRHRLALTLRTDQRAGTLTGLLLIDLDRFKDVNDTFGHHYGDELLTQVGTRLSGLVGEGITVARLGGDEFAVLLPGLRSGIEAKDRAVELVGALEWPFQVEGVDLDIEASAGVVVSGEHGWDPTTLLRCADVAMYVAKVENHGVFVYDPAVDGHSPIKLALLGDLRRALERGELVLHYQPQVDLLSGEVFGVEGLVRWQHPSRGLVMPDEFIPLAEHTGLIGPLTRQVLNMALAQARAWVDADRPLRVSVNLSARNLLDDDLPGQVTELLAARGVAAHLLTLEVTETAIMTEPVRARRLLEELADLGIRISIDDFGVGYTSLGQLKNLPVSELKIDRFFVTTMAHDPGNALIVRTVVDLGHNLGLRIVAEGVEDDEVIAALTHLGCDIAQGYHLSRPLPAVAFDAWYAGYHPTPAPPAAKPAFPSQHTHAPGGREPAARLRPHR